MANGKVTLAELRAKYDAMTHEQKLKGAQRVLDALFADDDKDDKDGEALDAAANAARFEGECHASTCSTGDVPVVFDGQCVCMEAANDKR